MEFLNSGWQHENNFQVFNLMQFNKLSFTELNYDFISSIDIALSRKRFMQLLIHCYNNKAEGKCGIITIR